VLQLGRGRSEAWNSPLIARTVSATQISDRTTVHVMTGNSIKMEILSGPEWRRRWSTAEKLAIVHETYEADATVSVVARRHGIAPNQLFAWRKLASQGALVATAAEEEVVPASESWVLDNSRMSFVPATIR